MLYDALPEAEEPSPAELRDAYAAELAAVLADHDLETVAETTGVSLELLSSFEDGDTDDGTLSDAATVLALDSIDADAVAAEADALTRDADALAAEVRDHLLMEMSTAILDVDTIAVEIDTNLTAKEVQQALEGRIRLTLAELAEIHSLIERRKR
jgi:hypothetical protein